MHLTRQDSRRCQSRKYLWACRARFKNGVRANYRVYLRESGCFAIEYAAGEVVNAGVYIFLDGLTGLPCVGKASVDFETRIAQHKAEGKRLVSETLAKFHVDPKIEGEALRRFEQVMLNVFGPPGKPGSSQTLSNAINALNKAKRDALTMMDGICK